MIINISRAKSRLLCRKKSFNTYHRKLTDPKKSMNLVDGSAFHHGVAAGLATKDWSAALSVAREDFEKEKAGIVTLPGMEWVLDDHWDMITKMIECYADAFKDQGIQVIQPECEFDVELPGSHHNCIWLHHLELAPGPVGDASSRPFVEKWGPPSAEAVLEGRVASPHGDWVRLPGTNAAVQEIDSFCPCWQPHRFVGKTDAVVVWNQMIWLLEHKTTAILGEQFWAQWRLDIQPTGYIYGIRKALGVKVGGFILNAIYKPSESQVSAWNKKRKNGPPQQPSNYIKYEREPFLRSEADLERFERELIELCNDWERDIIRGSFPMSPLAGVCQQYNRVCEFHSCCTEHDAPNELEALGKKQDDYVDIKTLKLAGIELPVEDDCVREEIKDES